MKNPGKVLGIIQTYIRRLQNFPPSLHVVYLCETLEDSENEIENIEVTFFSIFFSFIFVINRWKVWRMIPMLYTHTQIPSEQWPTTTKFHAIIRWLASLRCYKGSWCVHNMHTPTKFTKVGKCPSGQDKNAVKSPL